jgi:hypothetical protein
MEEQPPEGGRPTAGFNRWHVVLAVLGAIALIVTQCGPS